VASLQAAEVVKLLAGAGTSLAGRFLSADLAEARLETYLL
jgi:hypothetical protein